MSDVRTESAGAHPGPRRPAAARAAAPAGRRRRRRHARRFLTLREGSIIVVTILAAIYFARADTSTLLHGRTSRTLLPYFAPFAILAAGEVFVMVLGEIDLSIGSVYLFAPIMFYKLNQAGLGARAVPDPRAAVLRGRRDHQRRLHRDHRRVVVHHDARACCSRSGA